jgi:4-amino-4-deoxy-L-arabinose transferase-like glycosyltransferase
LIARVAIAVVTIALTTLVLLHAPNLNGPDYWQWAWRRVPPLLWYGAMLVAAIPALLAVVIHLCRGNSGFSPILLLMLAVVAMKLASVAAVRPPTGANLIADIVKSPEVTSYFTDAAALGNFPGWLANYHEFLYFTGLHTQSKPPGPVLYWSGIIELFGFNDRAAVIGGVMLGVISAFSILATWWMVNLLTGTRDAGFLAAAMLALCPGFVLFFPMLDPAYIILACGLIGLWHLTVKRDSYVLAVAFGAVLWLTTLTSYPLLSLGPLLFVLGFITSKRKPSQVMLATVRHGLIALLVVVVLYIAMWYFTGFDPMATFRTAWANQHLFLARHEADRRWPATVPWDLLDFFLGAAWLPAILATIYLLRAIRQREEHLALVAVCLAQPLLVALSGMIQSETARVWNFMLPLLLLPAALELSRWNRGERITFFACMWLLLAVIGQNMTFINPG